MIVFGGRLLTREIRAYKRMDDPPEKERQNVSKPTETTVRRLSLIKYLFEVGVQRSYQPEPANATSVLTLHDSVELFLQLACEHSGIFAGDTGFMEYWEVLKDELQADLPQAESMRRLNKSRVDLKHHGILPSKLDIEGFRASASNFFKESTPMIFSIEFESLSLVDLVSSQEVRVTLREAKKQFDAGQTEEASEKIALAFVQVVNDYENKKKSEFGSSPFFFGEDMTFESSFARGIDDLYRFAEKVSRSLQAIQSAMKILSLGIDYRRYSRFRLLTPTVRQASDGTSHFYSTRTTKMTREEFDFSLDFVVSSALRLQEFDYELPRPDLGTSTMQSP